MVSEEGPTMEVRWVCPGALATSMIDWFGPFLEQVESREDDYLVGQQIQGISVKIRGGAQLDMKVAGGSHGVLDIPGRARGHLQSWKKWSFPIPPVAEMDVGSADWVRVGKIRRIGRFSFADGEHVTRGVSSGEDLATCAVELTEVAKGEERWWTLGFDRVQRSLARRMGAGRIGLEVVRGVAPTLGSTSDADPVLNPPPHPPFMPSG